MRSSCAPVPFMEPEQIAISVVYALADRQEMVKLSVSRGTTVAQAVERSGLAIKFPAMSMTTLHCAIYGRVVGLSQVLVEGDRIEILRPLLIDPKEKRREAAARSRVAGR
jgi:putative ubiquitin-RnfH superfamily antitoxin RatB of RatAB toxin-antitoxin module